MDNVKNNKQCSSSEQIVSDGVKIGDCTNLSISSEDSVQTPPEMIRRDSSIHLEENTIVLDSKTNVCSITPHSSVSGTENLSENISNSSNSTVNIDVMSGVDLSMNNSESSSTYEDVSLCVNLFKEDLKFWAINNNIPITSLSSRSSKLLINIILKVNSLQMAVLY